MKKIDLGQTIGILANIGVIAGIIALIVELDQNNETLAFQARALMLTARAEDQRALAQNAGGLVDIIGKARVGEELTWEESFRLVVYNTNMIYTFAAQYQEVLSGSLEEGDLPLAQWRGAFRNVAGLQDFWEAAARPNFGLDPRFVEFIDQRVVQELD